MENAVKNETARNLGMVVGADTHIKGQAKAYDSVGAIMAFESGELDDDGIVELFQHLLDTGLVWQLQGSYGRMAESMINAGIIVPYRADKGA